MIVRLASLLMIQPALSPGTGDAHARSRLPARFDTFGLALPEIDSIPYLHVVGAVPLRFGAALPPPDLAGRPPAGGPPHPTSASDAGPALVLIPLITETTAATQPPVREPTPTAFVPPPPDAPSPPPPPPVKTSDPVLSILPDDTPSAPHAEDFLPFFQFPGGGKSVDARTPSPAPGPDRAPPSSATYQQQ